MSLYKILKQGAICSILLSTLSFNCSGIEKKKDSPIQILGEKYAVLCTGTDVRNASEGLIDPIDKNCFWISAVNVYNELIKSGHKPENIYVLYLDGKPPFDDEEYKDKIKEIKNEFDGSYSNIATKARLEELLNSLEDRIKPEDTFTLYLNMHGSEWGTIHFDYNDSYIDGDDLETTLQGNKSENIFILADTCHSEAFTDDIDYNSTIVSSSKKDFISWGDRNFSCGSYFFEELNNYKNDTNKDGKVSYLEAFIPTKERCLKYRKDMDDFLRNKYEGKGLDNEDLERMDLEPVYREAKSSQSSGYFDFMKKYEQQPCPCIMKGKFKNK